MKSPLISIVVPCLNEKPTIAKVINDARRWAKMKLGSNFEIVVADNGSTDGSREIIKRMRMVRLVNVPVRGYGAALHWGILNSRGKYILFADADCSYPFSNLPRFVDLIKSKPDLVLGSRLGGTIEPGAMPFLNRHLGTPVLTWLIRFLYSIPTTDCNSGMRLVRKDFYRQLNMRNSGMEWASELLLKTALKKGKYLEVPIDFKRDARKRPPHLSPWADGWRHLKAIILLRPALIKMAMLLCAGFAVAAYNYSFALTTLFILLAAMLFFSFLALKFLQFAIEGTANQISEILNSNRLVPWVMMVTFSLTGLVILLPDSRLGSKQVLIGVLVLMLMWAFLIETIKTHLINRLPILE